jgi:hypothetical protein
MTYHLSAMPVWAIVAFIAGFVFTIIFISLPARRAALNAGFSATKARNIQIGIIAFYVAYLIYVSALALKGIFDVSAMPPKVMVWGGLPLMIVLFAVIGNTRLFKTLLHAISLESLIAVHIFRVLGVFFIIIYGYGLLPGSFAFSAGLGDIITGIFALPVAMMVERRSRWRKAAVYAWNIFGMMDIINLLTIAVMIGSNGNLREMTVFPFVWFPAFAPATILFLHVTVFRKLHQLSTNQDLVGVNG